jgi:membrane complex biogenesis BtpA family protein
MTTPLRYHSPAFPIGMIAPPRTPGRFADLFRSPKPVIGVIHLPPLPGFEGSPGVERLLEKALADQRALEAGGIDAVLVENEEDHPHEILASPSTIAHMTRVTSALVSRASVPVGVEILLNDPQASVAVAAASGAKFIRTDYFVDRMERPEYGEMRTDPAAVLALRRRLQAEQILVFADVQVKYARMLEPRPLSRSARLARDSGADAVVVTGSATGDAPDVEMIREASAGAAGCPVLIGSGLDLASAALLGAAAGAIVGTSLKTGDRVDADKVRALVAAARRISVVGT